MRMCCMSMQSAKWPQSRHRQVAYCNGGGSGQNPSSILHNGGTHIHHGCICSLGIGRRWRHVVAFWRNFGIPHHHVFSSYNTSQGQLVMNQANEVYKLQAFSCRYHQTCHLTVTTTKSCIYSTDCKRRKPKVAICRCCTIECSCVA